MKKSTLSRAVIAVGAGTMLALAAPLAASAHVSIDPGAADPGAYIVVNVKVPNESETESTVKVEVSLPTDTPFSSVRYVPVAGWTTELVRETLPEPVKVGESEITEAVTSVVWTADAGSGIEAGQLAIFPLSLGPVPDTGSVKLSAEQTYSDGEVVSWSEDGEDAEHPAPVLYINDAAPADHHGGAAAEEEEHGAADESDASASGDDVLARILAIGALVVGAVGIVLAVTARRKLAA
ncbi:DUF1775 domain-containing protein [Glaciihabitans arcticus]|uniref:DUF1775 domain-containing protein n=1 Tax=Glaciihabitans arcticus TaxID=2668039 RepID=A0A4Q9GXS7_9MICO|nr:YcnI family protein [Glaciihabitans arcticus]TBN57080.1 DUF1775 domain-containing protein [Glaciihabitans arcticus]